MVPRLFFLTIQGAQGVQDAEITCLQHRFSYMLQEASGWRPSLLVTRHFERQGHRDSNGPIGRYESLLRRSQERDGHGADVDDDLEALRARRRKQMKAPGGDGVQVGFGTIWEL